MSKKKTEKNSIAQPPAVVLREGKWVTADGLCFNTATKAWNHVRELRVENEKLKVESEEEKCGVPCLEPETEPEPIPNQND
jgi:hypothetical protein